MLKPLNDNVIIEPVEALKKTASGIILAGDAAKPTHSEGVVVAVGTGKILSNGERKIPSVEVGSRVIYGGYSQTAIAHESKDLVILSEDDILAVIE